MFSVMWSTLLLWHTVMILYILEGLCFQNFILMKIYLSYYFFFKTVEKKPNTHLPGCNMCPFPEHTSLENNNRGFALFSIWNKNFQKKLGTSLVAQWLRIHLPMQGTRVLSLAREHPICRWATKPVCHNYSACTLEPKSHNYWACVP